MVMVIGLSVTLASVAVVIVLLVPAPSAEGGAVSYVNGTLEVGGPLAYETDSYFSLNTASPDLGDPNVEALVASTGIVYENSGFAGEYVNQSAGIQYANNGNSSTYFGQGDSQFIALCEHVRCHATLPVPGEIDDPGAAAVTVRYVEQTLGFHPEYWEIGNEPIAWTHFDIPWTQWRASDHSTPTPLEYAEMVQRYVLAIRSVDPSAQILGLQSDAGSPLDSSWFTPLMEIDGPNLSAVAYHSYAGGLGFPGNSAADFFATLAKPTTFPLNYPTTLATVRAACPSCATRVFVGEYNSALLGNFTGLATSYPEAPYIAAGLLEGLRENASQVTYYALQPGTNAGLIGANNAPLPVYSVFSMIFPNVTLPWIGYASVAGAPPDVYSLVSHNLTRSSVFVVDTNVSEGVRLLLGPGTQFVGAVEEYLDTPSQSGPVAESVSLNANSVIVLPPEGILLLDGDVPTLQAPIGPGAPGTGGAAQD
jgi:hypothetical protein